ncbi:hypothetical protein KIL84_017216 [Mauremys mutica]|uniref:Uncharacterized protein n=1 Tax=Mauremys mutica TaxID=74926 RepID=A0A9D3X4F3_9SAUR|nr:hypothetical protein KIL84_017216 [Mauremys mutica]
MCPGARCLCCSAWQCPPEEQGAKPQGTALIPCQPGSPSHWMSIVPMGASSTAGMSLCSSSHSCHLQALGCPPPPCLVPSTGNAAPQLHPLPQSSAEPTPVLLLGGGGEEQQQQILHEKIKKKFCGEH